VAKFTSSPATASRITLGLQLFTDDAASAGHRSAAKSGIEECEGPVLILWFEQVQFVLLSLRVARF